VNDGGALRCGEPAPVSGARKPTFRRGFQSAESGRTGGTQCRNSESVASDRNIPRWRQAATTAAADACPLLPAVRRSLPGANQPPCTTFATQRTPENPWFQ